MTALLVALALAIDLDQVKAEPDPGKRAAKALDYAYERLAEARRLAADQQTEPALAEATNVAVGAELALETLKTAKRNTGNLKRAEQRCRDLLRRLETFAQDLGFDDRPKVKPIAGRVQAIQEEFLDMILGRSR
jgi:hypothetical protein